jgi:hypothetical protein
MSNAVEIFTLNQFQQDYTPFRGIGKQKLFGILGKLAEKIGSSLLIFSHPAGWKWDS